MFHRVPEIVGVSVAGSAAFLTTLAQVASTPELAEMTKAITEQSGHIMNSENAFVVFMMTVLTLVLKNGIPGKKDVSEQFSGLAQGHLTLMDHLTRLAEGTEEDRKDRLVHREKLAKSLGGIEATITNIDARQTRMEDRVIRLEKKVGTGTYPRPNIPVQAQEFK